MASKGSGKRPASGGSGPPSKRQFSEAVPMGPIATLEEMDLKVLKFQNKKLAERLDQRYRVEGELRQRIEQLEKRQTSDDAVLNIVNRYWNQVAIQFSSSQCIIVGNGILLKLFIRFISVE